MGCSLGLVPPQSWSGLRGAAEKALKLRERGLGEEREA